MTHGRDSGDAVLVWIGADEGNNCTTHNLLLDLPKNDGSGTERQKVSVDFVRDPHTGQRIYPLSDANNLTVLEIAIVNEFKRLKMMIEDDADGVQTGVKVMSRTELAAGSENYYGEVIAKMDEGQFTAWLKGLRDVRYFEAARAALGRIGEYEKVAALKDAQEKFMEAHQSAQPQQQAAPQTTPPPAPTPPAPPAHDNTPPPHAPGVTPDTAPPSFAAPTKTTEEIIAEVKNNPEQMTTKTGNPSRSKIAEFAGRPVEDDEFAKITAALSGNAE